MVRLLFLAAIFGAGYYVGVEGQHRMLADRCLDAGGMIDPRGLCIGARAMETGDG